MFDDGDDIHSLLSKSLVGTSQFIEWMECNKIDHDVRNLTYVQFPNKYVWNIKFRKWTRRKSQMTVGRTNFVSPKAGEAYYLRILLNKVKGPTSYEDIRTVNGTLYDTFKDACFALGLLDDDKGYVDSIKETHFWACGKSCRFVFVCLITTDSLSRPDYVWKETCDLLSEDFLHTLGSDAKKSGDDKTSQVLYNMTLSEIEKMLNRAGTSLRNIPNMPFPDYDVINDSCNMLLQDELSYDKDNLKNQHNTWYSLMTSEQKSVYNTITDVVKKEDGGVFFLYDYGGTGKTFVWKTLAAAMRSVGDVVINVASSGIAALLLEGGRTTHSRFHIPINIDEYSGCSIQPDSDLAHLLNKAKLIIWDEASMMHRHCFEAFDRTMQDIIRSLNKKKPFGGKVVVFGGDFRQILPVIPKASRTDIVQASIHSSKLWHSCKVLTLTQNMRFSVGCNETNIQETKAFAEWILKVGEDKINEPNDGEAFVDFPEDVLINLSDNRIKDIVECVYPSFNNHQADPTYFKDRAILAPTNEEVDLINEYVLSLIDDEERVYYSWDSLYTMEDGDTFDDQLYSQEILNACKVSGIPNSRLTLKKGVPVMLLRNVDQTIGLCNNTRPQILRLGVNVIEAKIITGASFGEVTYIPRMKLIPSDKRIPLRFQHRHFPLAVCFAMTINKSQGQSLSNIGLFLRKLV